MSAALEEKIAAADSGQAASSAPSAEASAAAAAIAAADARAKESEQWSDAAVRLLRLARTMLRKEVAAEWTDERLKGFGDELAGLAAHYGWRFGAALTHPALRLAIAAFPLAWPIAAPYVLPYLKSETPAPASPPPAAPPAPAAASSSAPA